MVCYIMVGMLSQLGIVLPIGKVALRVLCHGRCILLPLIFYFKHHMTVGYFT